MLKCCGIFSQVVTFLSKVWPPYTQLVLLYRYTWWFCNAFFCHVLANANTANCACLHSL